MAPNKDKGSGGDEVAVGDGCIGGGGGCFTFVILKWIVWFSRLNGWQVPRIFMFVPVVSPEQGPNMIAS